MKKNIFVFFTIMVFIFMSGVNSNGQTNESSKSMEKKDDYDIQKDKGVKIKRKPQVELGNCSQPSGVVILRVSFDKSAKITNIETTASSGCDSFDKNAVQAAKR